MRCPCFLAIRTRALLKSRLCSLISLGLVSQHLLDEPRSPFVTRGEFRQSSFDIDEALEEVPWVDLALFTITNEKRTCGIGKFGLQRGELGL